MKYGVSSQFSDPGTAGLFHGGRRPSRAAVERGAVRGGVHAHMHEDLQCKGTHLQSGLHPRMQAVAGQRLEPRPPCRVIG